MTKIEIAQAVATRRHQDWLDACQKVLSLIHEEETKAKTRAEQIRVAAEAKILAETNRIKALKTPEIVNSISAIANHERASLGLCPK